MALSRRAFSAGAAALASCAPQALRAQPGMRIAALTWPAAQSLTAIGPAPACAPEIELYARLVAEPALPPETLEIGLRPEPNLERLLALKLDLILIDEELERIRPRLARIAPVEAFDGFLPGSPDHYETGSRALRALAARIGREAACEAYLAAGDATIEAARQQVAGHHGRPLLIASVVDARRALVFGRNSLFQSVLDRLGLKNAWDQPTSPWGHSVVTLDRLAEAPDALFVNVDNERLVGEAVLIAHPVVGSLPAIRARRIVTLAAILFYGGAPAAIRFARLLGGKLAAAPTGR